MFSLLDVRCHVGFEFSYIVLFYFSITANSRMAKLIVLSLIVITTFAIIWLPFLEQKTLIAVIQRLFPLKRGLYEVGTMFMLKSRQQEWLLDSLKQMEPWKAVYQWLVMVYWVRVVLNVVFLKILWPKDSRPQIDIF